MAPAGSPGEPPRRRAPERREAAIDREERRREIDWVARARAGDPRAFRALYDVAFRLVWAWSLQASGDSGRAARLTAATLRRAFESLARYDGSLSFGAWLLGHARAVLAEDAKAPATGPRLGSGVV